MGYSIQNSETGEVDYINQESAICEHRAYDAETGEPSPISSPKIRFNKSERFQIPKKYLRGTPCEEFEKVMTGEFKKNCEIKVIPVQQQEKPKEKKKFYQRDDFINMEGVKREILLGYSKANYIMFLVPTLFIFNIYVYIFLSLVEIFLHCWAHTVNGLNMNKSIYYRSPLHVLSSQFCAKCRSESEMEWRIFETLNKQMRHARKSQTLKEVTKALG